MVGHAWLACGEAGVGYGPRGEGWTGRPAKRGQSRGPVGELEQNSIGEQFAIAPLRNKKNKECFFIVFGNTKQGFGVMSTAIRGLRAIEAATRGPNGLPTGLRGIGVPIANYRKLKVIVKLKL